MNIRVDLDNTKEAFDNSLIGQDEELKTLIKNTEREIQSRSNDNLDKQNGEVQMRLGELYNQIELTHDRLKREKLETDEHFRNIGQSISSLKDESQHTMADKISELEEAVAHNIKIKVMEMNKKLETMEEKHGNDKSDRNKNKHN